MQFNDDSASESSSLTSANSTPTLEYKNLANGSIGTMQSIQSQQTSASLEPTYIFLLVQLFEAINFYAYEPEFISSYANISILLEIESMASLQFSREALSDDEINR